MEALIKLISVENSVSLERIIIGVQFCDNETDNTFVPKCIRLFYLLTADRILKFGRV